ncbi:MAG: sulfatase-like hydrolase/transferase, partial [Halioglobus sp.]|nr:sulfatase-like hydrolase/transferase [Halioglobus sp.]
MLGACQEEPARPALAQGERPNVVLLLVDDLRWDETSYGGNLVATPNIDWLAGKGVRFQNAYVTSSLCSPSRASFLTGVYPHTHGVYSNSTGLDFERTPTIAQLLQEAGYNTGLVGKWHMGGNSEPRPGFDHWLALPGQGEYEDPVFNINGKEEIIAGYNTDLLTDAAIDFIDRGAERPFYLHLGYKAVHAPFLPAPRHRDALVDEDFSSIVRPTTQRDRLAARRLRAQSLLSIDDSVGRIVQHLRERDLLANTVLVFTSDNGFLFGEHGHSDKRLFYEESIRIPWLVYRPGLPAAGQVIEEPVLNIDFLPSMLALAGIDVPHHVQGRSFAPLLQGKPVADWRDYWVYEYFAELAFPHIATHLAVVGPDYKYVWFPEGAD